MWCVSLQSKQEEEAKKLMESTDEIKKRLAAKEVEVQEAKSALDAKVTTDWQHHAWVRASQRRRGDLQI